MTSDRSDDERNKEENKEKEKKKEARSAAVKRNSAGSIYIYTAPDTRQTVRENYTMASVV